MSEVEAYTCGLCGGSEARPFLRAADRYRPGKGEYTLVQCAGCGLISLHPVPGRRETVASYPLDVLNPLFEFGRRRSSILERAYAFFHPYSVRWRQRQVEEAAGVGRLLDVGCGTGDFLYAMRQRLWEVAGVEDVPHLAEFARHTLGLKIFPDLASLAGRYPRHFDVITFWHTFDRYPDLHETLRRTLPLLHSRGAILLGLSNPRSVDFWFYRRYWASLDVPRRLYHLTPRHVAALARRHGLQVEGTKVIPFDIYYNTFLSEKIFLEQKRIRSRVRGLFYLRGLFLGMIVHILSVSGNGPGLLYCLRGK